MRRSDNGAEISAAGCPWKNLSCFLVVVPSLGCLDSPDTVALKLYTIGLNKHFKGQAVILVLFSLPNKSFSILRCSSLTRSSTRVPMLPGLLPESSNLLARNKKCWLLVPCHVSLKGSSSPPIHEDTLLFWITTFQKGICPS